MHLLYWLAVAFSVIIILWLTALIARRKAHRAVLYLAWMASFLGMTALVFMRTANATSSSEADAQRVVYLGWTDSRILAELSRRWTGGRTVLVARPDSETLCARYFAAASFHKPLCGPDGADDGITVERAFQDLRQRLPQLANDIHVYFVAPRAGAPADCFRLGAELVRDFPHLRERLHVVHPGDLKADLSWPRLVVDAPLTISPDAPEMEVGLLGEELPADSTRLRFRVFGPKQGPDHVNDTELTVAPIKQGADGRLSLLGDEIKLVAPEFNVRGKLPAPKEGGRSLTLDASLTNDFGEVLAWNRATTTSQPQPIGVLVPASRIGKNSALEALLADLKLEHENVVLDLRPQVETRELVRRMQRWRVLLCDQPLTGDEATVLQKALREAPARPKLLFVGSGSDDGTLPTGWQIIMKAPVKPAPCRIVLVSSDKSGSMFLPCGAGQMKKFEMATLLAQRLAPGLENRRWNSLIMPVVGPNCDTKMPDGSEATVLNYAIPNQPWELDHMLRAAWRKVQQGYAISDCVFIYDPEDVHDDGGDDAVLPTGARQAAEELTKRGVRLWLIAAGPHPVESKLGTLVYGSTITSLGKCQNDPMKLLDVVERQIFEQMFPRLELECAADGPGLTKAGHAKLKDFVESHSQHLRLLNGLTSFSPREKNTLDARTTLWLKHWQGGSKSVVPLLVHGIADLGAGQSADYLHLGLDLTAERARIPSGTSAQRNSLAGIIVRIIGALNDEMQQPGIYWLPNPDGQGGLCFFAVNHKPLRMQRQPDFDRNTLKGVGLGLKVISGFGRDSMDALPDIRRLQLPALTPTHLDRHKPSAVRFVIEDERYEIGRLGLTVTLTGIPPLPLSGREEAIGAKGDQDGKMEQRNQALPWLIPGWAVPVVFVAGWCVAGLVLWRRL